MQFHMLFFCYLKAVCIPETQHLFVNLRLFLLLALRDYLWTLNNKPIILVGNNSTIPSMDKSLV